MRSISSKEIEIRDMDTIRFLARAHIRYTSITSYTESNWPVSFWETSKTETETGTLLLHSIV